VASQPSCNVVSCMSFMYIHARFFWVMLHIVQRVCATLIVPPSPSPLRAHPTDWIGPVACSSSMGEGAEEGEVGEGQATCSASVPPPSWGTTVHIRMARHGTVLYLYADVLHSHNYTSHTAPLAGI
jgi:hypothetical protein